MKFGHYSNAELGIKRNLTCSMFESKGVDVECANYSEQQLAKARRQYAGLLKEAAAAKEQARKLEKKLASAPDEQVATIKSEILRFRQDVVDKIAEKLNAAIKSQTNLSECKASREVYQEYSQTCDVLSSLTSEILKRETKIKKKQRQANRKMSNDIDEAKDVECGAKPGTKVLSEALLAQHLHDSYDNEPGNGRSLKSYIDASVKHILDIARENDIKRDPALMRKWIKEEIIGAYKELTHLSIKDSPENRKQMKRILQQFDSYITKSVLQARLKNKELFMSNELDDNAADVQCANTKFTEDEIKRCAEEMAFMEKKHFSDGNGKQLESIIRSGIKSKIFVAGYLKQKLTEDALVQRICNTIRNIGDIVPDRRHDKKRHEALIEAVVKYYTPYIKAQVQSAKRRNKDVFMSNTIDKKPAVKYIARCTNKKKTRTLEKKKPISGTGKCTSKRNIGDEDTN